jgi:diguanylate cyclase (GGDEF)-like protein
MSAMTSAPTNELTGLLTRKAFHETFDGLLEQAKGTETPIALAFIDIDNFMRINTEYGHVVGDEVLKGLADLIRVACGEIAIPVRYGGDEFAVIFPGTEREQAFLMLEKMRLDASQKVFSVGKSAKTLAISGGIACYPIDLA